MGAKSAFAGLWFLCLNLVAQTTCEIPAWQLLRYDEDYGSLRDPKCRQDVLDVLKYIPLDSGPYRYLSLGGEIRQRYEYLNNSSWGLEHHDGDGYSLQRYMLHADLHWSDRFRVFAQVQDYVGAARRFVECLDREGALAIRFPPYALRAGAGST